VYNSSREGLQNQRSNMDDFDDTISSKEMDNNRTPFKNVYKKDYG